MHRDPNEIRRSVLGLSWHPDGALHLAAAFGNVEFQHPQAGSMSLLSYIWDVRNPNQPLQELAPSSSLCSLEYNQLCGISYDSSYDRGTYNAEDIRAILGALRVTSGLTSVGASGSNLAHGTVMTDP